MKEARADPDSPERRNRKLSWVDELCADRACRKLEHRSHDGLCRLRVYALMICESPKQRASSRFCSCIVRALGDDPVARAGLQKGARCPAIVPRRAYINCCRPSRTVIGWLFLTARGHC